RRGGPHVRELLLLGDVHVHVLPPGVLPHDLTLVHLRGRLDDERATLLEVDHRVRGRPARPIRDERAGRTVPAGPGPRLVAVRDRGSDAGAPGPGEEAGADPDQAARWHDELDAHPARAVVGHRLHAALALREQLRDRAEVLLG